MEDLVSDTSSLPAAEPASEPKYDVYFSYGEADKERVKEMTDRLRGVLGPEFRWWDQLEGVPGESEIETREKALERSARVAVLVGPGRPSKLALEEMIQGVRLSVHKEIPAFFVYLPDCPDVSGPPGATGLNLPPWLRESISLDLREQFDDDGRLRRDGLASLVAGVRGMSFRGADEWLAQQERPPASPSARQPRRLALIAGIGDYEHYPSLPSASDDMQSLSRLLRPDAGDGQWELSSFERGSRNKLAEAARSFFAAATEDDTLLFYFSGHGAVVDRELYLAVGASDPGEPEISAFPVKVLARYVSTSVSRRKIVILDCCFSGEAADGPEWGRGSAVLMTFPQAVNAGPGTSELTRAITAAWQAGAQTTGDLADHLGDLRVRRNSGFDRSIPLPPVAGAARGPAPDSPPSARLTFNEIGELYVGLSPPDKERQALRVEMAGWDDARQQLFTNLIQMIDAVVSLVPSERLPSESLVQALLSLGADLLGSALPEAIRGELGASLAASPQLQLELSFDDRWAQRGRLERLPWESLLLCGDGQRPVRLERVVRARDTKSATTRRPSRVIAWNAFQEPKPHYSTGARHLLTHLLLAELKQHSFLAELVIKEPAQWGVLYQTTDDGRVARQPGGGAERIPITDFDTFVLFAPISMVDDEPEVWFPKANQAGSVPTRCSTLADRLKKWAFSYLVIETIAGQAAPLLGTTEKSWSRACSLQATTRLATKLARELGVTVVAVCHLPGFFEQAQELAADGEETTFMPSFSGQFLRQLADPATTLSTAVQEARRSIVQGLNLGQDRSLVIGLPVVCRPEPDRTETPAVPRGVQPSPRPPKG